MLAVNAGRALGPGSYAPGRRLQPLASCRGETNGRVSVAITREAGKRACLLWCRILCD